MLYETAHPAFPEPTNTQVTLWRYLDAFKFKWLATEKRLFMPSAANLGDPLEGIQPPGQNDWWLTRAGSAQSEQERETIKHNRQLLARFAAAFRTRYYVSCWHMNEGENPRMWAQYAKSSDAVAVRTRFTRLRATLKPYVRIGIVRYIDYSTERLPTLNMFEYITHKNMPFAEEQELRAVAMHPVIEGLDQQHFRKHHFPSESDPDFLVYAPPVNLQELVEAVVLHPQASQNFATEVRELCAVAGLPEPTPSTVALGAAKPLAQATR
jgi:hypothetical protein